MKRLLNTIAALAASAAAALAADARQAAPETFCNYRIFNIHNGLPSNHVTTLYADSRGYLWIGTRNGICKFDGYRFASYPFDINDTTTIWGHYVCDIGEYADGKVLVTTFEGGLNIYDPKTDRFIRWSQKRAQMSAGQTTDALDTDSRRANRNSVNANDIRHLDTRTLIRTNHEAIGAISNLKIFDTDNAQGTLPQLTDTPFGELCRMARSSAFVTSPNGLYEVDKQSGERRKVDWHNLKTPLQCLTRYNKQMICSSARTIWEHEDMKQPSLLVGDVAAFTQSQAQISYILRTENDLLWVGTDGGGLLMLDLKTPNTLHCGTEHQTNALDIYAENSASFWIAAGHFGLLHLTTAGTDMRMSSIRIDRRRITTVMRCRNGRMLVGTDCGIYERTATDARCIATLGGSRVNHIFEDSLGYIWVSTSDGLYMLDNDLPRRIPLPTDRHQDRYCKNVNATFEDHEGRMWIGTNCGILMQSSESDTIRTASSAKIQAFCFATDARGNVLAGTSCGLMASHKGHLMQPVQCDISTAGTSITDIARDNADCIWLNTEYYIFQLNPDLSIRRVFDESNGMAISHNTNHRMRLVDNTLFVGNASRFNLIDIDRIRYNSTPHRTMLCGIRYETMTDRGKVAFVNDSTLTCKYMLGANMTIDMASTDFSQPERNHFRIRIDDGPWSAPTTDHRLTLPSLTPVTHKVEIQSSNESLVWSANRTIYIDMVPPLWLNKYTIIIYIALIVMGLRVMLNYRYKNIKRTLKISEREAMAKQIVEKQRNRLAKIHKDQTDSINYAKRLQEAMMPRENSVRHLFDKLFVLYLPKDIVSGDFYSFFHRNGKTYIVAADCTGHGVPGAFISIIGIDHLQNIIMLQQEQDAGQVLTKLHHEIHSTVNKQADESTSQFNDGMDMTLCIIDHARQTINFAGAMNDLYMIRDNLITIYKGDRCSIGTDRSIGTDSVSKADTMQYTTHRIDCMPGDSFYIFSDGYADQFGGPEHKKLKYRRFKQLLLNIHKLPAPDQKNILLQKFSNWKGDNEQTDDVSVIGFSPWK